MYTFSETQLYAVQQQLNKSSFRKFSATSHLSVSQIRNMLNGVPIDYRISTLERVAGIFNVPVWFFIMVNDLDNAKLDTTNGKKLENIFELYMNRLTPTS